MATARETYEKQAKRMDALAATSPSRDMRNDFLKLADAYRVLASQEREPPIDSALSQ
jgi:hypothetical protein